MPFELVTEWTLRVTEAVSIIESRAERGKRRAGERPIPPKVVAIAPHRSLRAKAHDRVSDFELKYPW